MMKSPDSLKKRSRRTESGNVFILILLGIVLFASLSFFVARSMQSSTTNTMTSKKADLAISDFSDMAGKIQRAVSKLRMQGCSESDISFFVDQADTWFPGNTNAPSDKHCHVFEPEGGNVRWDSGLDALYNEDTSQKSYYSTVWGLKIAGVGEDDLTDIVYSSWYVSRDACIKYNNGVGVTNPGGEPPYDSHDNIFADLEDNDFEDSSLSVSLGDSAPELVGQERFCYQGGGDVYEIINVILAR